MESETTDKGGPAVFSCRIFHLTISFFFNMLVCVCMCIYEYLYICLYVYVHICIQSTAWSLEMINIYLFRDDKYIKYIIKHMI